MRDLLLMNDYDADPLWHAPSGVMANLDDLPLSDETRTRARAWARRWDELASQDLEANYGDTPELAHKTVPPEVWAEHEQEGNRVWSLLRPELGEGWRVGMVSFPDGRRHVQWEPDGPLELCLPTGDD